MQQFRKILVGIDCGNGSGPDSGELSASTRSAVDKAIWLAQHTSAELTFLSSLLPCLDLTPAMWQLAEMQEYQAMIDGIHANCEQKMAALVDEARSAGINARELRTAGKAWQELLREAVTSNYDLIIVGSHQQHAMGRLLLGNTGRRLVRKSPCPVWVTSPVEDGQVSRILVPTDFTDTADQAIKLAHSLAERLQADLHVLHSMEFHFEPQMRDLIISLNDVDEYRSQLHADASRELNQVVSRCGLDHAIALDHRHIAEGPADAMIHNAVTELGVDLVVMNTLGRTGLKGLVVGNTAEKVLNHLTCSILAIKPDDFQCPIEFPARTRAQELEEAFARR